MNKKKLWIIILLLTIVAALTVAAIAWLIPNHEGGLNPGKDSAANNRGNDDNGDNGEKVDKGEYTVTFYSSDGTVLKAESVKKGASATPPSTPQMLYGIVFKSWDVDFSGITEDVDVKPIYESVKGKENIFAIDGAYGKSGDTVIVPIRLCGDVCLAAFDLTISYDSSELELISVTEDGAVLYNDEALGKIRLNYVSTDNTVSDVDVCYLEFSVKAQPGQLPVTLEVHNVYACKESLESNNDDLYVPEYSVINGTVFVLPKGE